MSSERKQLTRASGPQPHATCGVTEGSLHEHITRRRPRARQTELFQLDQPRGVPEIERREGSLQQRGPVRCLLRVFLSAFAHVVTSAESNANGELERVSDTSATPSGIGANLSRRHSPRRRRRPRSAARSAGGPAPPTWGAAGANSRHDAECQRIQRGACSVVVVFDALITQFIGLRINSSE